MTPFTPYCGQPPVPGTAAWTLGPLFLGVSVSFLAIYFFAKRHRPTPVWRTGCFVAGWSILVLALVSPLCNLSVALFSARVAQHIVLAYIAAPLIAAGLVPFGPRVSPRLPWVACVAFFVAIWAWHSPVLYDATLRNNIVYWAMHVTIIASSIILWFALLSSDGVSAFLAATSTGAQMSLLGAILTFARHPLFEVHAFTTAPWGFSQIEDQQLGGLLMWIPAGLLLTGYSIAAIGLAMRRLDAAPQREYLQRRA